MRFNYANTCQLNYANISMLHVYINKSPVQMIMLHVDIIYLAERAQKYVSI